MPALTRAAAQASGTLGRSLTFLLDIDGTLVHTDDLYFRVFQKLLQPFGYNVTPDFYKANVHGKVDSDVFSKLMPDDCGPTELLDMSKKKDALFCELFREQAAARGPPLLDGLGEALGRAKALGVRCIAVTNAQRGAAEACIASLRALIPAADIIEGLVIGAECKRAKPSPDPYLEGMRLLGVTAEECVVFEDSRSGIRAGLAAGVPVVGLRSSLGDEELRGLGCAVSLADWHGLDDELIRQMAERKLPQAQVPT